MQISVHRVTEKTAAGRPLQSNTEDEHWVGKPAEKTENGMSELSEDQDYASELKNWPHKICASDIWTLSPKSVKKSWSLLSNFWWYYGFNNSETTFYVFKD